ncbi:Arylsulfatase [Pontiella desulfatans]|uniref:Arylsulfatase n=1 Tax=Pontiella desulfatans TaxID=2750659 RepID=A0A6C2U031_PONDE|nr:sulfatase-like hydrolase/transferase [Pontiella desulfatans]SPS73769.1 sulfatase S1_16 [Kiritimatiellales bacterium]VGO13223.1 Arylsulfatase [Pontiella desulfatans]
MRTNEVLIWIFGAALLLAGSVQAADVTVAIGNGTGESGTQVESGAFNASKNGLDALCGTLWGVANTANRDGMLYWTYSDLAGTTLPDTIQPGIYTFTATIGNNGDGAGFSGLNDISSGTNTDGGSVAGFFATAPGSDAETSKNNMLTEFNGLSGVTYMPPSGPDPATDAWTTWTFAWTVAEGSPVVGTDPFFGVYTKTGIDGGNGFWDDSVLGYTPASASARRISINFHVSDDADAQADHELTGSESAGAGAYATTNWNNIAVGSAGATSGTLFSPTVLADDSGDAGAATIAPSVSSSRFVGYCASSASGADELGLPGNDDDLFNSYLALGTSDAAVLQVTGISSNFTANGYRVVVYSDTDKRTAGDTRTSIFELTPGGGSAVTALTEDDGVTFDGTYVISDNANTGDDYSNYTVFEGLTADSFTLAVSSPDGGRGGISGLQIITGGGSLYAALNSDETWVTAGSEVTLSWLAYNADSVSIDQGVGDVTSLTTNGTGQVRVYPTATTTYTLSASNASAGSVQDSVTVTVGELPPVIHGFSANTHVVETNGTPVTLSWVVSGADTVSIVPDIGLVPSVGQTNLVVDAASIYTLTASRGTDSVSEVWRFNLAANRPNILLMLVDDYGPMDSSLLYAYDAYTDAGTPLQTAFNDFYHTPHMETLAANGMKFTQAYAMPMCSPTRVSLMTGYNSPRHGVTHHLNVYETIDNASFAITSHRGPNHWRYLGMGMNGTEDVALPQLLKDAGYHTFMVGKDHLSHVQEPDEIGFDVIDCALYKSTVLTPKAEVMIEDAVALGEPFFGYISWQDVHSGFYYATDATNDYSGAYNDSHAKFATMVESVDNSLGAIVAKLEEQGVAENTLIIFLGDNGSDSPALSDEYWPNGTAFDDYPMRGKKGSTYEGGIRVPLLVAWAAPDAGNSFQQVLSIPAGGVEHDIVTVEDIAPTILSAVGAAVPNMDGYDLTPYLRAEAGTHRPQKVLRHMPHEHRSNYFTCFRDGDWKILYRYHIDDNAAQGVSNEDYPEMSTPFELYNLADDPDESDNLVSSMPEKTLQMARAMARELDASWGDFGPLWPTLNPGLVSKPARPLVDDPFVIDFSVDGRDLVDSDGDGLADVLEDLDADGLVSATETSADASDTDGDGSDDYTELRLNLDPRDAAQAFVAEMALSGLTSFSLSWPSAPGTTFNILSGTNLQDAVENWQVAASNIPATAASNETTATVEALDADAAYYRIELNP